MNYENLYENFSPLKFKLNNDYIDKLQQDQPIMMSFDNALTNLKSYLNDSIQTLTLKYDALYQKSHLITSLEMNTLKIFLGTFIILYLVAPKFELIRKDELNKKAYKPNLFRIGLIALILALFYLGIKIDLLVEFQQILFA